MPADVVVEIAAEALCAIGDVATTGDDRDRRGRCGCIVALVLIAAVCILIYFYA